MTHTTVVNPARARVAAGMLTLVMVAATCICVAVLGTMSALFWRLWGAVSPVMLGVFAGFMIVAVLVAVTQNRAAGAAVHVRVR